MSTDEERTESEVVDIVIDDDEPAAGETTAKTEEKPEAKPDEHSGVYVDQKAFTRAAKRHKFLKVLTISLASVFVAGYAVMVILSFMYFQPNTIINGVDYSFRGTDSVQQEIDGKKAGYEMHIKFRDSEFTVRPDDIGLVITTERDVKNIKENQNPFLWFAAYFRDPNVAAYSITYDEAKFEKMLSDDPDGDDENA